MQRKLNVLLSSNAADRGGPVRTGKAGILGWLRASRTFALVIHVARQADDVTNLIDATWQT
jgi:hypothetical protein